MQEAACDTAESRFTVASAINNLKQRNANQSNINSECMVWMQSQSRAGEAKDTQGSQLSQSIRVRINKREHAVSLVQLYSENHLFSPYGLDQMRARQGLAQLQA